MAALLLSAVGSTGWEAGLYPTSVSRLLGGLGETYVALSADHLVAVELGRKGLERWLYDTTPKTEDQVKG